jgi:hypothetical protein
MLTAWIAMEHYRMHAVENWPASPLKSATLAAIRSALESLGEDPSAASTNCTICSLRNNCGTFSNGPSIAADSIEIGHH